MDIFTDGIVIKRRVKDNAVLEGHAKGQEVQRKRHELQMGGKKMMGKKG